MPDHFISLVFEVAFKGYDRRSIFVDGQAFEHLQVVALAINVEITNAVYGKVLGDYLIEALGFNPFGFDRYLIVERIYC